MADQNTPINGVEENQNYSEAMLVILGAGASHDCLPSTISDETFVNGTVVGGAHLSQLRPPLTQQLAELGTLSNWFANRWDSAVPVISYLRSTLGKSEVSSGDETVRSLEGSLREYESGSRQDLVRRRHILALSFYLRDLFSACTEYVHLPWVGGGDTNHLRLLDRVRQWGGGKAGRTSTFVSFNYDLILERAMTRYSQFDPLELSGYLSDPLARLLKPHGSACWHWGFAGTLRSNNGPTLDLGRHAIERALSEDIDRDLLVLQNFTYRDGATSNIAEDLLPALALPSDGKNEFVWPPEQNQAFEDLRGRVTRLMTIGWRALEPHFVPLLGPLIHPSCRVLVVAGGADGEQEASRILQRLQVSISSGSAQWRTYGEGFTGLLERSGELEWFLRD